jgi:hypothetical protein
MRIQRLEPILGLRLLALHLYLLLLLVVVQGLDPDHLAEQVENCDIKTTSLSRREAVTPL